MSTLYKMEKLFSISFSHVKANLFRNGVNAIWWSGVKNFGDLLTPELLECYGKTAVNRPPKKADYVGVGSILHLLPKNYSGTILGSGCMTNEKLELDNANFAFVRGELTKELLNIHADVPTGDLGLLAPKLLISDSCEKKYKVGLIPHYVDKFHPWLEQAMKYLGSSGIIIDVQDSAKNVINAINSCDVIYSSSLHGIIVADALKIPNVWIQLSDLVVGGGFKFLDYNSSIDYEQPPVEVREGMSFQALDKFICEKKSILIDEKFSQLDATMNSLFKS